MVKISARNWPSEVPCKSLEPLKREEGNERLMQKEKIASGEFRGEDLEREASDRKPNAKEDQEGDKTEILKKEEGRRLCELREKRALKTQLVECLEGKN